VSTKRWRPSGVWTLSRHELVVSAVIRASASDYVSADLYTMRRQHGELRKACEPQTGQTPAGSMIVPLMIA
jgi:hypothetical protein